MDVPPPAAAGAAPDTPAAERPPAGEGTAAWVGPFAVFMAWLALDQYLPLENPLKEVVRDLVILAASSASRGACWRATPPGPRTGRRACARRGRVRALGGARPARARVARLGALPERRDRAAADEHPARPS
jgi:hypothetical protein